MKNYYFILILFLGLTSCKELYNLPEVEEKITSTNSSKFQFNYPENWIINTIHSSQETNSLTVSRYKKDTFKNAWFKLTMNIDSTDLELKEVLNELIEKDYNLRKAKVKSIKHSNHNNYIELDYTYRYNKALYRSKKRFYKKNGIISEISFSSKDKDFKDFIKYRKLFLESFQLK
ncbi:hypothetical protein SHK09_00265 [Polaribacter sp. PL03]|uniref:hypothetical protein n=1 Tax=Polaribacter sp. PL03 TaxID=3088353 RepID=UPI0029CBA229|nr:hypothetical protein [Polaribacter sp. PL03]MDX6745206.1 hypothetical protein [Polaribacter sp. PL03]